MPADLWYILLVLALFVLPQVMQRMRLPTAVTSLGLGAACGIGFGLFQNEATISLLSVFGIVALFLFAGLEVDFAELRQKASVLLQHVAIRTLSIAVTTYAAMLIFHLDMRPATIFALALLTPSTGFILSSLHGFGLSDEDRFLVKAKAIAAELLALGVLFVCTQSSSSQQLVLSGLALTGLVVVVPVAMWIFARFLMPHAPRSEFAFLLVLATVCAYATKTLGAYYLLGAFLAGVIAQRTRAFVPELVSPRILDAIELFASFFIPFYFFHAGLQLRRDDFGLLALELGAVLIVIVLPLRIATILGHRRIVFKKPFRASTRIATALLPTLVFTLVLANILREQFGAPDYLIGGLIIYTLASTVIPGFVLRSTKQLDFTAPEAAEAPAPREPGADSTLVAALRESLPGTRRHDREA
jgi:Kef-type K+ transport system membrane component KefB